MGNIMYFGSFMYFPDNKLEYIPSVIQLLIFLLIAILVFRLIKKISAKELDKAKQVEERMRRYEEENHSNEETK